MSQPSNKHMLSTQIMRPRTPELVTPYTLTLTLAYLHYYTPKRVAKAHLLPLKHLRNIASWIDYPRPQLRSLQQHKILALHLALLHAAGFIDVQSAYLSAQPVITSWLHTTHPETVHILLQAVTDTELWSRACADLGLQEVIGIDNTAYLQQSLARQLAAMPQPAVNASICWLANTQEDTWLISIPPELPLWLHFDLRQLGHWSPTTPLTCAPYSIAAAAQKGYSAATIQWLLETAAQTKLPYARQRELQQWARHRDAYKLRAVHLLTTARPSQMAALLRRKRLRAYVYEHLAPRHAAVSPEIQPHLQKWLAAQGYPLDSQHPSCPDRPAANYEEQPAMQWLALRVLIGLREIIPPSYPSPYNLLAQFDAQLSPAQKTNLEATATNILDGIRDAIRGRDAFFPQPIDAAPGPQHRHIILQAIADETPLDILYQGLTDQQPIPRTIYPLRLEDHGALSYLYAYCENAEAERTFRLDRIKAILQTPPPTEG